MNKNLRNKIIFYLLLLAFIVLVSTHWLEHLLDILVGVAWSHPIVNFLFINIQGFIILFFISLYSDLTTKTELTEIFSKELNKVKTDSTNDLASILSSDEMIKTGFKKKFGNGGELYESMLDLIGIRNSYFTDCYVDITLGEAMNGTANHFSYDLSYGYQTITNSFVLACTVDTSMSETLITRNLADEVICILPNDLQSENILSNVSLKEYEMTRGGRCIKEYKFKIMNEKEKRKHVAGNYGNFENCKFYKVTYDTLENHENKLRFSFKCDLAYADGYCYWNSPRLMFVKRITVDLSPLNLDVKNFKIQPFLSCSQDINTINHYTKKYHIEPNDWINRGQGIAIIFPNLIS